MYIIVAHGRGVWKLPARPTVAATTIATNLSPPPPLRNGIDSAYLGALWMEVFETPSVENPFGSGGEASGCFALGDVLIFGLAAGSSALSVAHGWVALLHRLAPDTHIVINGASATATAIVVDPHD